MQFLLTFALAACKAWSVARMRFMGGLLLLIGSMLLPNLASAQTFPDFTVVPTLQSGTALQQGAVYRFASVLPGIDALVTLAQFSSTTVAMINIDDNTIFPERFQPVITCAGTAAANASTSCYIRFDFSFVQTGTSTPTFVYGLSVDAQDIDGNSGANGVGVREFVEFVGASSVNTTSLSITSPSFLVSAPPFAGGVRFIQEFSSNVQNGIGTDNRYEAVAHFTTGPITGFSVLGGNDIGTGGCDSTNAGCQRQNSYSFRPVDATLPSVTVRKISTGGTGTFTFTGTNGWVTQPVTTTVAGIASTLQSEALLTPGVATTITESAPFGYSLTSIVCSGLGAGTATPTVNGTAGGSVLLSAAATVAPNAIVCTFTNRKLVAGLSISKTDGTTTVAAGKTTTYTIVASNTAGDDAAGAIVRDPAVAGLSCTAVTCTGTACPVPASVTVAALQSSGITLGAFPAGASVTFSLTCGVTATGQ